MGSCKCHVCLVFGEVKIKEDLVYDKHSSGFVVTIPCRVVAVSTFSGNFISTKHTYSILCLGTSFPCTVTLHEKSGPIHKEDGGNHTGA